jgi:hypothetical protein
MEAPVGGHDVVRALHCPSQLSQSDELRRRDPRRRHLGALAGQSGQDRKVVDNVLWGDPDDGYAAARRDRHQAFVGQLEYGLADRSPADAEFLGEVVEIQPVPGLEAASEDTVA